MSLNRHAAKNNAIQTIFLPYNGRKIVWSTGKQGKRCFFGGLSYKAATDHTRTVGRVSRIVNDASVVLSKTTVYMADFNLDIRVVQFIFGKGTGNTEVNGFLHFAFDTQVARPVTLYGFKSDARIPTMKNLRAEKEKLLSAQTAQYKSYTYFKDYYHELQTACRNVDIILEMEHTQQHSRTQPKRSHKPSL